MNEYPRYQVWIQLLNRRDEGVLFVFILMLIAFGLLVNARGYWPKLLTRISNGLLVVYYLTFGLLLAGYLFGHG